MSGPIAVTPIGSVATGSLLWRQRGALQLALVAKASFTLRHGTMMDLLEPVALHPRDQHHDDDPTRSLAHASDLVPHRPLADVWLTGHAYAPAGKPAGVTVARLALYRGDRPLFDKAVHVYGDRRAPGSAPAPFARMPLVYERAYGGADFDENPVGVGADGRALPNLVQPAARDRCACFGPVSRYWRLRRGTLAPQQRKRLEQAIAEVPDELDWAYFQVAPLDQRVEHLRGDEWVVLDGMHPSMLRVQSRLPKVRAVARVRRMDIADPGYELALSADTLAIDADAQRCSVTWRASVPVASEQVLGTTRAAIGLELDERAVDWAIAWGGAEPRPEPVEPGIRQPDPRSDLRLDRSVTLVSGFDDEGLERTGVDQARRPRPQPEDPLMKTSVELRGEGDDWADPELDPEDDTQRVYLDRRRLLELGDRPSAPPPADTDPGLTPVEHARLSASWEVEPAIDSVPTPPEEPTMKSAVRRSIPPQPLDREAYARELRAAGASEEEIAAALALLGR